MTSDKDELEKAVQENLRLRRELGAEARDPSGGMAYRLGWVLYWACLAPAAVWVVIWLMSGESLFDIAVFFPLLAAYGLGRAFRYVLSGE